MKDLDKFAMAALSGTAQSALESEYLAQRAYDIAKAYLRISQKPKIIEKNQHNGTAAHKKDRIILSLGDTPITKENFVDTSKPRFSRNGKYIIPSDNEIFEILYKLKKPTTSAEIRNMFNSTSEHKTAQYHVLSILERICGFGRIYAERSKKPILWSTEPIADSVRSEKSKNEITAISKKPKRSKRGRRKEENDTYSKKMKFAESLGFKNVADAMAKIGKIAFEKKYLETNTLSK